MSMLAAEFFWTPGGAPLGLGTEGRWAVRLPVGTGFAVEPPSECVRVRPFEGTMKRLLPLDDETAGLLGIAGLHFVHAFEQTGQKPPPGLVEVVGWLRRTSANSGHPLVFVRAVSDDGRAMKDLTLGEVSAVTGWSGRTVRRRLAEGRLKARKDGRRKLVALEDLEALLNGGRDDRVE